MHAGNMNIAANLHCLPSDDKGHNEQQTGKPAWNNKANS